MTKVTLHRLLAAGWLLFGGASFFLHWQQSVALVWAASVYANIMASLAASEAADDAAILEELRRLRAAVEKGEAA